MGAYTKIGITDDLIVGESRDAIMAGVNLQTGVIETKGYYESGDTTDEHPVSHIKMIGFQFPKWDELLEMLNEVATNMISTSLVSICGKLCMNMAQKRRLVTFLVGISKMINIGGNIIKRSFKRKLVLLNISVYKSIQTPIFEKSMFR